MGAERSVHAKDVSSDERNPQIPQIGERISEIGVTASPLGICG